MAGRPVAIRFGDRRGNVMVTNLVVSAVVDMWLVVLAAGVPPGVRAAVRAAVEAGDVRRVDAFINRAPWRLNAPVIGLDYSLLSMAAGNGQSRLAEHLRSRGARVDMASAARLGWDEEVRRIAKADPDAITRRGPDGPPIIQAVIYRRPSTVKLLVDLGSPLQFRGVDDGEIRHVLTYALGHPPETIEFLLARTADADLKAIWDDFFAAACGVPPAGQDHAATARVLRLFLNRRPRNWDPGQYLRVACWAGNVPAVKLLLAFGADPNAGPSPRADRLPLALAAWYARSVELKAVVLPRPLDGDKPSSHPDEVNAAAAAVSVSAARLMPFFAGASVLNDDEGGDPPVLHLAAVSDRIRDDRVRREIADLLVGAGARWTPAAAVALGRADLVRRFVAADPELAERAVYRLVTNTQTGRYRQRSCSLRPLAARDFGQREVFPLEAAAERGDLEVVRLLLTLDHPRARGGELNAVLAALRVAVERGHLAVVRAIVAEPRQATALKDDQSRVFELAGRIGNVPIIEALTTNRTATKAEASAALRAAAANGHLAAAKRAYTLGGHVSVPDYYGNTALVLAAAAGYVDVVRWLLAERADPDQTGQEAQGALHQAAMRDFARTIEVLLAGKADPNLAGSGGQTPLMVAAANDAPAAIRALAAGGAKLGAIDPLGSTALHAAVNAGSVRAVRELLALGADRTVRDNNRKTALDLVRERLQTTNPVALAQAKSIQALLEAPTEKK